MLRNAEHRVTLIPPLSSSDTSRSAYATVATLTTEERKTVYVTYDVAVVSVRIDDGGPIGTGWAVVVTTPAPLAGTYDIKLVAPSRDHVRVVAERRG